MEYLADRVLLLCEGRIPVSGTKADVTASIEELELARLQPPPLVEVLAELRHRGLNLPAYASSTAEAASLIAGAMEGAER